VVELEAWYDWENNDPTIVRSAADLDAVINTVKGYDGPVLIQLHPADPRQGMLVMGVDAERGRGTLFYQGSQGLWFSKGVEGDPVERVLYYYMNSDTEYPADSEIPLGDVVDAAHEFVDSGAQRPTRPTWQAPPAWYPRVG
jgi:hypothetical protein